MWIRLNHLPLPFFNPSCLQHIGNSLGTFFRVDFCTLSLSHPMYARICVEVDVSIALLSRLWLGTLKEEGF